MGKFCARLCTVALRCRNGDFMKTEETILGNFKLEYPLENLASLDQILFLDIETTGFLAASSTLYLIGCAYYTEGNWIIRQWFAQTPDEEAELLKAFFDFSPSLTSTWSWQCAQMSSWSSSSSLSFS